MRHFRQFTTNLLLGTFCATATFLGPYSVWASASQAITPVEVPKAPALGSIGGDFQALEHFSLRVDDVKAGPVNTLEVFATIKNSGLKSTRFTAGTLNAFITDADGVGFRDAGNLYSISGDPPTLLSDNVMVEGKGEARVRYIFSLPKGYVPLRTLTFEESGADPRGIDISGVKLPGATEPGITVSSVVGGSGGFAEFGPYDVRLDGVKRGRNNTLHAYFTFKNVSGRRQQFTVSDFNPRVITEAGTATRDVGNLYRASGAIEPAQISHTVVVANDGAATVRYIFKVAKDDNPRRIVISTYGDIEQSYDLPKIP